MGRVMIDDMSNERSLVVSVRPIPLAGELMLPPKPSSPSRPAELDIISGGVIPDEHPLMKIAEAMLRGKSSAHTRRAYAKDLRTFLRWCLTHGVAPHMADRDDLITYKDHCMQNYGGNSPGRMLSVVRGFYLELELRQMLPGRNPMLQFPKVEKRQIELPAALTLQQARELLDLIRADGARDDIETRELLSARDYAIVKVLLTIGARRSALIGIRRRDVRIERGYPIVLLRSKGNTVDQKKIPVDTYQAIMDWIEILERRGLVLGEEDPVFIEIGLHLPEKIVGLGQNGLYTMARRRLRQLGIEGKNQAVHYFRASFITLAHEGGADLALIAETAGHRDTRTTQGYVRRADKLKRAASDYIDL